MAIFNSAVLTHAGNELLVTAAAGRQIEFTRLVTGCGIYTDEERVRAVLENAESLKQQKQEFPFSAWEKASEQSVLLKALITNKELTEGYKITEIGVYGKEVGAETDVLCSIALTNSIEESDSFPPYNGLRECQIIQEYYITISPDAEVTVNMQGAAALAEELEKLKKEFEDHTKVVIGDANTPIENNTILLICEENGGENPESFFSEAAITNIVISSEKPLDRTDNWGMVEGKLTVGAKPEEDTTFFAQIN